MTNIRHRQPRSLVKTVLTGVVAGISRALITRLLELVGF
jgi:hypothetical protein